MPRLVEWPIDLSVESQEAISGPSAISGGTSSITGQIQTVSSPFGLWEWALRFPPMQGEQFRRFRGFFAALQQGANATRWTMDDPDRIARISSGIATTVPDDSPIEVPYLNGKLFTNGRGNRIHRPPVAVARAAQKGDSVVSLSPSNWGMALNYGDLIGFFPFHFGMYIVTERISAGQYRVWPPLRKALAPTDYATLSPRMVVRMKPGTGSGLVRDAESARGMQMTVVEVKDEAVRAFYTG
jgi:hypothetical protein